MKPLVDKVRPTSGYARIVHILLNGILPVIVYALVRIDLVPLAFTLVLLSKWRMLAVKPRFWLAHIRTNSIDIIVSLSFLAFITATDAVSWQVLWTLLFMVWLVVIKPGTQTLVVGVQAIIGFSLGLIALFMVADRWPLLFLVAGTGIICYAAAHHFFDAFEEKYTRLLSFMWAWFGAGVAWVLGHWLLFYGNNLIAQPALLLVAMGYGLAALYYLDHYDRLTSSLTRQFVFIMVAITAIILTFSDWGDKIV